MRGIVLCHCCLSGAARLRQGINDGHVSPRVKQADKAAVISSISGRASLQWTVLEYLLLTSIYLDSQLEPCVHSFPFLDNPMRSYDD